LQPDGVPAILATDGDVTVRHMRDDPADYALIARWLSDERVLEYYDGRDRPLRYDAAVAKYGPRARGEHYVRPCIIEHRSTPVGYLQYYPVQDAAEYELDDASDTFAIDMFIGEPDRWQQGIGSRALKALVHYIFEIFDARRVVIDPHVDNPRAQRAYEKAGFRKVKVLKQHELHEGERRDAWLMVIDAQM